MCLKTILTNLRWTHPFHSNNTTKFAMYLYSLNLSKSSHYVYSIYYQIETCAELIARKKERRAWFAHLFRKTQNIIHPAQDSAHLLTGVCKDHIYFEKPCWSERHNRTLIFMKHLCICHSPFVLFSRNT